MSEFVPFQPPVPQSKYLFLLVVSAVVGLIFTSMFFVYASFSLSFLSYSSSSTLLLLLVVVLFPSLLAFSLFCKHFIYCPAT